MVNHTKMEGLPKPTSDLTEIIEWVIGATMFCISWIYFVNRYFKSKAEEKQDFIQNVVKASVTSILDSELATVKGNINKLFEYREEDRKHIDGKFDKIMTELKK